MYSRNIQSDMNTTRIKEFAKRRVRENRWSMTVAAFIPLLLTAMCSLLIEVSFFDAPQKTTATILAAEQAIIPILLLSIFFAVFIVNVLIVGNAKFFRNNIRRNEKASTVFDGFRNYKKNAITMLLMSVITVIGFSLFIIPGIILCLEFVLVPYILAENSDKSPIEILKYSRTKMNGYKQDCFLFGLSFIGWIVLDILTLGIAGVFYVHPLINQSYASYCDKIIRSWP